MRCQNRCTLLNMAPASGTSHTLDLPPCSENPASRGNIYPLLHCIAITLSTMFPHRLSLKPMLSAMRCQLNLDHTPSQPTLLASEVAFIP